jgi:NitT/TauT family transport system permease protein
LSTNEASAALLVGPSARTSGRSLEQTIWSSIGIVAILLFWQVGAMSGALPVRYVSSPALVVRSAIQMIGEGNLIRDLIVTVTALTIGMAIAVGVGIPLGILIGWYRRLQYVVDPYLAALYATPSLALLPLLVVWFGIGIKSTVVLVIISAFFPIVISVEQGVKTVDANLLRMARSFSSGQFRIFRDIVLPATVPFIASGLQLGTARGLIGVVVGEMYAASNGGLGYVITVAGSAMAIDQMFVAVTMITALGIILLGATRSFERRMQYWKLQAMQ